MKFTPAAKKSLTLLATGGLVLLAALFLVGTAVESEKSVWYWIIALVVLAVALGILTE